MIRLDSLGGSEHCDVEIVNVLEKKLQGWKYSDRVTAGTLCAAAIETSKHFSNEHLTV